MRTSIIYDLMPASERTIDPNTGYMRAPAKLSRTGVQKYRARELRGMDGAPIFKDRQPEDFVFIHRPESEVLDPESIASFEDMPITSGHPDPTRYPNGVTADTYRELAIGHVRDCKAGKDGFVHGTVHIRDAKAVREVFGGKSQLSCGYSFDCESKPGVAPDGQRYDGVMHNIRGNHLATVYVARGGPGCAVADHQPSEENMGTMVKLAIDGIDHQVPEESASLVRSLLGQRDEARSSLKAKEEAHAAAVVKLAADHAAELGKLRDSTVPKDKIAGMVADQCALLADAAKHCPSVKVDGLDATGIRRAMVTDLCGKSTVVKSVCDAVLTGTTIDKATDEQVATACNAALASVKGQAADGEARRDHLARSFGAELANEHRPKKGEDKGSANDSEDDGEAPKDLSDGAWNRRFHGTAK